MADNSSTDVLAKGEVLFSANVLGETKNFRLENTLHVPDLRTNLLSVRKITDRGLSVSFNKDTATISDSEDSVILTADRIDGLYYVGETMNYRTGDREIAYNSKVVETLDVWHRRL